MISVTILTKNSEKYLAQVLTALQLFNEVTILDTGSSDATVEIAQQFSNVTIHHGAFCGFGPSHNLLSQKAKNDWILSIDSDEIVEESLVQEILTLSLNLKNVYSFRRKNFYRGKHIKGCGWWPDRVVRLYHRGTTSFTNAHVHESIITTVLTVVELQGIAHHFPYASIHDFLQKMQHYTTLFAEQNSQKKKGSFTKAITHGFFAFFRSYILKNGWLLGSEGFEISFYNANCAFYKYLKLREATIRHK